MNTRTLNILDAWKFARVFAKTHGMIFWIKSFEKFWSLNLLIKLDFQACHPQNRSTYYSNLKVEDLLSEIRNKSFSFKIIFSKSLQALLPIIRIFIVKHQSRKFLFLNKLSMNWRLTKFAFFTALAQACSNVFMKNTIRLLIEYPHRLKISSYFLNFSSLSKWSTRNLLTRLKPEDWHFLHWRANSALTF